MDTVERIKWSSGWDIEWDLMISGILSLYNLQVPGIYSPQMTTPHSGAVSHIVIEFVGFLHLA